VNPEMKSLVKAAGILSDVVGSDHCPVSVTLDL
jgi:exonuclease III